jgi:zinc protease
MKNVKHRFFPLLGLLLAVFLVSCAPPRAGLDPGTPPAGALTATLANGLRVVIVTNDLAPAAATIVNYLVGSDEAPAGFPGMAHAQEHMMFRGSPSLSADQLAAIISALGGRFDADTRQSVTQYYFTVPAADVEVALRLESIRMREVLDAETLWEAERGAIDQEVARDLSNPEYVMYSRLLADVFRGTVYDHDALGTRESFGKTTGAMLKRFYDAWYAPNNAVLVVAGNVDPPATLELVRRLFGDIPMKTLPPRPAFNFAPVAPYSFRMDTDRATGSAVIAFRLPGARDPDFAAARILAAALSNRRGALDRLVTGGQALEADFSLDDLPWASLGYAIASFPAGADGGKLADGLRRALADVKTNGVPADLVAAAKRKALTEAEFAKNSIFGQAMLWSEAIAVDGASSPEALTAAIEKVTKADVDRLARSCLDFNHCVTALLIPKPSGAPVSEKGFGGPESPAVTPAGPVQLPDWAAAALGRLSVPPFALDPRVFTLANGIRLIVQSESVSDTVSLYGRVETNPALEEPAGREGVESIMNGLFDYGTASLGRAEFQKALDNIAADAAAGTEFSLQVPAAGFERGLALLADNLLHPAFPEEAFRTLQRRTAAYLAGRMQTPQYRLDRLVNEALLPAGDPALRQTLPVTVTSLTLGDVREYYGRVMRPDMTVIVIVGKVDPAEAKKSVEVAFSGWKAGGPKPDVLLPPVPPNAAATVAVADASRVQESVTLIQTLGLALDDPDRYALNLANKVLGGGFYASRLYRDLREKTGLVYNVGSTFDVGKTRSFYSVAFGCDPPNAALAAAIVRRDLALMRTTPVDREDLELARALIVREGALAEASVPSIGGGLLSRARDGLPLDEPVRAARVYLSLTPEEVRRAFARWIRPDGFVQASLGPPR